MAKQKRKVPRAPRPRYYPRPVARIEYDREEGFNANYAKASYRAALIRYRTVHPTHGEPHPFRLASFLLRQIEALEELAANRLVKLQELGRE